MHQHTYSSLSTDYSTLQIAQLQSQNLITQREDIIRSWALPTLCPSQNQNGKVVIDLLVVFYLIPLKNPCDLKNRKHPKPNTPTSEEIYTYWMPVCFGYLLHNPKNRSCSHTAVLQPCNCTSPDRFGAYVQQPHWKMMRFDTIQPDCVKSRSFRVKLNSTKASKIQGYDMWSTKSVNTESDSRFLKDEKKNHALLLSSTKTERKGSS